MAYKTTLAKYVGRVGSDRRNILLAQKKWVALTERSQRSVSSLKSVVSHSLMCRMLQKIVLLFIYILLAGHKNKGVL